jgi:hypothetical protein
MLSAHSIDRTGATDLATQTPDLQVSEHSLSVRMNTDKAQEQLAPVWTLPNEIILEIFIRFLPIYPFCPPLAGLLSPTLLTHICRRWREIALDSPELWRAIQFSYDGIPSDRQLHIANLWLRRSDSPLSIRIAESHDPWAVPLDLSMAFSVLVPHRSRWEYLNLGASARLWHLAANERRTPLLRHFHLTLGVFDGMAVHEAPLLRSVVLDAYVAANIRRN